MIALTTTKGKRLKRENEKMAKRSWGWGTLGCGEKGGGKRESWIVL